MHSGTLLLLDWIGSSRNVLNYSAIDTQALADENTSPPILSPPFVLTSELPLLRST